MKFESLPCKEILYKSSTNPNLEVYKKANKWMNNDLWGLRFFQNLFLIVRGLPFLKFSANPTSVLSKSLCFHIVNGDLLFTGYL